MEGQGKRVDRCTVMFVTAAVYDTVVVRYAGNGLAQGGLAAGGVACWRLAWQVVLFVVVELLVIQLAVLISIAVALPLRPIAGKGKLRAIPLSKGNSADKRWAASAVQGALALIRKALEFALAEFRGSVFQPRINIARSCLWQQVELRIGGPSAQRGSINCGSEQRGG